MELIDTIFWNVFTFLVVYLFLIYSGMLYMLFRSEMRIRLNFIPMNGLVYGYIKVFFGICGLYGIWNNIGSLLGMITGLPFIIYPLIKWWKANQLIDNKE